LQAAENAALAGNRFPVVGIGASAGGVEALQAFFAPMPPDPGMGFIVVTHLAQGQKSALVEILARATVLPVVAIGEGEAVQQNQVYVLAADAVPSLRRGRLRLRQQAPGRRERNTVDVFFASLAEDSGENSVGVILSGSGYDGTLGVKAIKERGGLTIAQQPDHGSPRFPDMPQHAIASGAVDLKLPVEEMAGKLVEYARTQRTLEIRPADNNEAQRKRVAEARDAVCTILRDDVGHDFFGYKEGTFLRRIERRMQVLGLNKIETYVERLRADHREVLALFQDLLIGVTAFFRDQEAFAALANLAIPQLFAGKGPSDTVRVWVPGCATGEEVYSIAILLIEHMSTMRAHPKVVCFATDIDDPALAVARAARYPAAMLENVSQERLARFFNGDGLSYTLIKEVREICIFSSHSVIRDPPFSRIDLISCRNLLIYLDRGAQDQIVPVFHFALRPGGYLFLGTSESLSEHPELFVSLDKKHRILQRRDLAEPRPELPLMLPERARPPRFAELHPLLRSASAPPLRPIVESRVIEQFAPAHVVVTRDGEVVHFSTRTGKYLETPSGAPSRDVVAMARRGLRLELHSALAEAVETRRPVRRPGLSIEFDGRVQMVELAIEPLSDHNGEPLFLVVFSDIASPLADGQTLLAGSHDVALPGEQMEGELRDSRERLQVMVEEYETALEELKSANEELVSVNEELQSTNEELETSREEVQSINEELNTTNSELQRKIEQLDRANDNLRNLFEGTQIATVFLSGQLVIRSFTPAIKDIFSLVDTDRGRPLTDIVSEIADIELQREIEPVLASGEIRERRVLRRDGTAHYLMRVLPYRALDQTIDGVLVTFTDISRIIEVEAYQEELGHRVEGVFETVLAVVRDTLAEEVPSEVLINRLNGMTETYGLVSNANWGDVPLGDLAAKQLSAHGISRDQRVALDGPPVLLKAKAAVGLGMALYELTANATTSGALSVPQGCVNLDWTIEHPDTTQASLLIRWRESGGPPAREPEFARYGTHFITTGLKETIGASGSISFADGNVLVSLELPLSTGLVLLREVEQHGKQESTRQRPRNPLQPHR
jgi:two-component system CheB/CheR fusion protein